MIWLCLASAHPTADVAGTFSTQTICEENKVKRYSHLLYLVTGILTLLCPSSSATASRVTNSSQLSQALKNARPGTVISIEPGDYPGGIYISGLSGARQQPIVIQGTDANNPPVFSRGSQALHLSDCSFITLRNIKVRGFPANGINIDDGGSFSTPAHHILIENVAILQTGPKGNHDALKMSGIDHFTVRHCRFEGWGGSGIDMVGCHHGLVEDCTFVGREGFSQSNAVQLKGGTEDILVQCCLFRDAGQRSINLGGSTGLQFFRPDVGDYEAKNITIAGNCFIGSIAPVAWVTADGGHVHHNTIILPEKWILRILQEAKDKRFKPCHHGVFERNLIVFDSRVGIFVNVGPATLPETFTFRQNAWHEIGGRRKPSLPAAEVGGIYLTDLQFDNDKLRTGNLEIRDSRLKDIGATAYRRTGSKP